MQADGPDGTLLELSEEHGRMNHAAQTQWAGFLERERKMKFEELAKELDDTYSVDYEDRDKALGEFERKYKRSGCNGGTGPYNRGHCERGTNRDSRVLDEGH